MSRFLLSDGATRDLAEIKQYLNSLPARPAMKIGKALREALSALAQYPQVGRIDERYTAMAGEEIRIFPSGHYVIVYAPQRAPVTFLIVAHGKRDIDALMLSRF